MRTILVLVLVLGGGCATMSTLGTPTTVAPGKVQWSVAPEVSYAGPRRERLLVPAPEIAVAARVGVHERADVGLKVSGMPLGNVLTTVAVEGSGKVSLYRGGDASRWDIAAASPGRLSLPRGTAWSPWDSTAGPLSGPSRTNATLNTRRCLKDTPVRTFSR